MGSGLPFPSVRHAVNKRICLQLSTQAGIINPPIHVNDPKHIPVLMAGVSTHRFCGEAGVGGQRGQRGVVLAVAPAPETQALLHSGVAVVHRHGGTQLIQHLEAALRVQDIAAGVHRVNRDHLAADAALDFNITAGQFNPLGTAHVLRLRDAATDRLAAKVSLPVDTVGELQRIAGAPGHLGHLVKDDVGELPAIIARHIAIGVVGVGGGNLTLRVLQTADRVRAGNTGTRRVGIGQPILLRDIAGCSVGRIRFRAPPRQCVRVALGQSIERVTTTEWPGRF